MARHRSHSIEFKRQVAQEFIAGETLYGLAVRHGVSRNLIRVWVMKFEAGAFDKMPKRPVCFRNTRRRSPPSSAWWARQALEIEFLKGALKNAPRPRSGTPSVISGPKVFPPAKDAV